MYLTVLLQSYESLININFLILTSRTTFCDKDYIRYFIQLFINDLSLFLMVFLLTSSCFDTKTFYMYTNLIINKLEWVNTSLKYTIVIKISN